MRNWSKQETSIANEALRSVAALLPASWKIDERTGTWTDGWQVYGVVDLVAPDGERVSFVVEAKRSGSVPTAFLLSALRELRRQSWLSVLLLSDYVGPSLRSALEAEGISYADATGWVRLASEEQPVILLTGQGAERSPRSGRRSSAVMRLNGIAANRTIRSLATTPVPVGVRALAEQADVSPGSVSKLLVTLTSESIVERNERGGIVDVRRRALIRRWIQDYAFATVNTSVGFYIAPRGLDRALSRLDSAQAPVALTASAAARRLLPPGAASVVPLRLLALYSAAPAATSSDLGLIEAESAVANVVLAVPQDPQILAPAGREPQIAPMALVIADLLTLPNRSESEADQLMDVLARTDDAWMQ